MNFRKFALLPLLLLLLLSVAASLPATAASIAEPPVVVHGKVIKSGSGGRYQLFSGTLHVKLVNSLTPSHVLELDVPLRRVGVSSEFSYRVSISQETAPAADRLATTLVTSSLPTTYLIQSATLNGYPAELLDPSQAAQLTTSCGSISRQNCPCRIPTATAFPTGGNPATPSIRSPTMTPRRIPTATG